MALSTSPLIDRTAAEALSDCRWHLSRAADALTAAGQQRPLYAPELRQAREQLERVAAELPRLPK